MPNINHVIFEDAFDIVISTQQTEWRVDRHHSLRQVSRVFGIVACPGDGANAQDIEWRNDRQTPRGFYDPAWDGGFFQRWFHPTILNIDPRQFPANQI